MSDKRLVAGLLLALHSGALWALGLGNGPASVVLGQALDFAVSVRLDSEETLNAECVNAEVLVGERAVPASVRVRPAGANMVQIRVATGIAVDEPVVTVQLSAGCAARVQRRYVVFADPAAEAATSPAVPAAEAVAVAPAAAETPAMPARTDAAAASLPAAAAATPVAPPSAARPRSTARERSERTARGPRAQRQRAVASAVEPKARATRTEARPRLMLEPAEATAQAPAVAELVDQAIEVVAQAATATRAAASAASASAARIANLEATVQELRGQAESRQGEVERLRSLLDRPQPEAWWWWPMLGLLFVLGGSVLWLIWRLRGVQRAQDVAWARASAAAAVASPVRETSPLPLITSTISGPAPLTPLPVARAKEAAANAAPQDTSPVPHEITAAGLRTATLEEPPTHRSQTRTMPMPSSLHAAHDGHGPRDVSIEELIDVDQQAEFFLALGQEHAAIDLLVAHLRETGGGSPLTYLKLLEIYQRVGDEGAYERTRQRFNRRYNAYAPQWGSDLTQGRSIEQYEAVLPRLQAAWPRPLDAMAELEALLFRKSRGELFELPAYRDVLFLYSIARDRMERESGGSDSVDLLLPLDFRGERAPGFGNSGGGSDTPIDEHPTAPLDLDLSPPSKAQDRIFGEPLTPTPLPPRR